MNIAFAVEHFNPRQGGAERYASGLARWLVERGHSLDVYTQTSAEASADGLCVHPLAVPPRPRWRRPARFAAAIERALEGRHYDVVHGFNHARPCDVLRLGGGVHLAFEEYNALSAGSAAARAARALSYRLLPWYRALRANEQQQFADRKRHFIAVSQRVADDMKRFYPSVGERIHVIRNGVDTAAYNPAAVDARRDAARSELRISAETLTLLFVSNNFRLKGLHALIEALGPAAHGAGGDLLLLVVGRGSARPFDGALSRCGVRERVRFCGPTDDLTAYYAAADLLVHPSFYDAFGFVPLEAVACGLPVVVSRNSGVSEILEDGNGAVLINMPCAPADLAAAILRAAQPDFRERARESNPRRACEHSIEKNYEAVLKLYRKVAAGKK